MCVLNAFLSRPWDTFRDKLRGRNASHNKSEVACAVTFAVVLGVIGLKPKKEKKQTPIESVMDL